MTLSTQFLTMLAMIGMGCFFGASLDTYNRFLKRSRRKHWMVFINDILFWLFQGLSVFYVLFSVNLGELRFYIFVALLCGFAAYQSLLKRIYLKILEVAISVVVSVGNAGITFFRLLVIRPLQLLVTLVFSLFILIGRGLYALLKISLSIVLWTVKIIWKPFQAFFLFLWALLPKRIKKIVEKLYNKMAGIMVRIKNYVINIANRIKNIKS
ncbi:spore cortex biosynthesis protein YabQ [Bacillus sp. T33-2]|uniref:spore cortex biosynthesis protein YabQ n=1 Tax=Bacillus sp. T33-2 TaxID=2054168 RepID=UPI000C793919|nr:spore cortex biosynthesis protein YabQ [Bacillus sp. T33-2]PLR91898.1 spore cortex biosynthesis protein YabQ [Bacillus sp. T33-2]